MLHIHKVFFFFFFTEEQENLMLHTQAWGSGECAEAGLSGVANNFLSD